MDDRTIKEILDFFKIKEIKSHDNREVYLLNEAKKYLWNRLEKKIDPEVLKNLER